MFRKISLELLYINSELLTMVGLQMPVIFFILYKVYKREIEVESGYYSTFYCRC